MYIVKKGEDGLVLTQPPNICSGPLKTGQIQSSFFSKLASVNIGTITPNSNLYNLLSQAIHIFQNTKEIKSSMLETLK